MYEYIFLIIGVMQQEQVPCSLQLIVQEQEHANQQASRRGRRGSGNSVNNFIQKTFDILQEKKFESIVGWCEGELRSGGCSFKIHNVKAFQEVVLPQYFKHSNMSSFVRQLNMYNFHKVRGDKSDFQFQHERFVRNRPDLLHQIKRKQIQSSLSIPSIALIAHPDPEQERQQHRKDFQVQAEQLQIAGETVDKERNRNKQEWQKFFKRHQASHAQIGEFDSPQKDLSVARPSSNDQELPKLAELQELNRSLKKAKQAKTNTVKQLILNNRANMVSKFNKMVMAIISSKLHLDLQPSIHEAQDEPKYNLGNLHEVVDHIMDSSQFKSFKEYMAMVYPLFDPNDVSKDPIFR